MMDRASSLCLPRFSWSQTCLYHGASETDLISIAGAASFQLFKLCSDVEDYICSSLTKPRALLLLLGSGGISLWILLRKKEDEGESTSKRIPCSSSNLPGKNVSWFRWLFSEGEKDFFFLREDLSNSPFSMGGGLSPTSLLKRKQTQIAPCPNCQRGICRLRKHQGLNQHTLICSNSNVSSYCNSPISRKGSASRFLPPTSTPDSADDENSDSEDFIYFQLNNHSHHRRRRSGTWLSNTGSFIANRSEGEGMSDPSINGSKIYYPTAKLYTASKRSPGDGQDHFCASAYGPSSLSSGEACDCPECLNLGCCRYEREESVDSIISATGSMVELIKGAREVRKLIREASFDSLTSDLSFNTESKTLPTIKVDYPSSDQRQHDDIDDGGTEEDQVPPCLRINESLNKNFYSMIALSSLDFDPTSSSGVNSLEWESPTQGWHDVREAKYKMSLPPESDQELEWDAEITETLSIHEDEFMASSFCSGLELDMETELLRTSSACSSRRSSLGNVSVRSIGKRLPPSGRSSAERELSEPPAHSLMDEVKFHLSPLYEVKEPRDNSSLSTTLSSPQPSHQGGEELKKFVPSDSLYISLRGSPPDNIEIINNNG